MSAPPSFVRLISIQSLLQAVLCLTGTSTLAIAQQAQQTAAAGSPASFVETHHEDSVEAVHLVLGRSLVVNTKNPLKRVYIGNPTVLQSFTAGTDQIILTAKTYGVSSLVLWDTADHAHLYSVSADLDCEGIRAAFRQAFPEASINLETREGKLFLSGSVPTDLLLDAAYKMATSYAKEVVNALRVVPTHGKQVQLKLRIIEVDRSKADQFGINFVTGGGRLASSTTTSQFGNTVSTGVTTGSSVVAVSDPLNFFLYSYKLNFGLTIKDMESRQILQVLAEPTLTTISGLPARFLSGGEFPVPVVQGGTGNGTALSIIYRPYGVKVDFTPTVNVDGTIRLKVSPEVSTLDYTNSVTVSGTTVPALSTRRADTEVEIRDGESFIVSGLLDHRTTDSLAKTPGISNIPILGQLFRSKNLNRSVIELVVLVTATVVDPLNHAEPVVLPNMVVPNMNRDVFDGRTRPLIKDEEPQPAAPAKQAKPAAGLPGQPATVKAAPDRTLIQDAKMVQVAAVTQQSDADLLIALLVRRGYAPEVRLEPTDKLLHVQTGPYASLSEAKTAQQRLLNDGFHAVLY